MNGPRYRKKPVEIEARKQRREDAINEKRQQTLRYRQAILYGRTTHH